MESMKFLDAVDKSKGVPFYWETTDMVGWLAIPIDSDTAYFENIENGEGITETLCKDRNITHACSVEFFDEGVTQVKSGTCTCDFHTVILRIGCQCGGK